MSKYTVFLADCTPLSNSAFEAKDDLEAMKIAKAKYPQHRGVMVEREGRREQQRLEREAERNEWYN